MAVTNYYTVNGRIRAESSGGTRTTYLPDALGSVTATMDESGSVLNTYRYKPYGSLLSKSGMGGDPRFQWQGKKGIQTTGLSAASHQFGWHAVSSGSATVLSAMQVWHNVKNVRTYNPTDPRMGSSCIIRNYLSTPMPYTTKQIPDSNNCGSWKQPWIIDFNFEQLRREGYLGTGLVIQHVWFNKGVGRDCRDDSAPKFQEDPGWEYWVMCDFKLYRRFDFYGNCNTPNPPPDDTWFSADEFKCHSGTYGPEAVLMYVDAIPHVCLIEWGVRYDVPPFRGLFSTTSAPPSWEDDFAGFRKGVVTFDCGCEPCTKKCRDDKGLLDWGPATR